MRSHVKRAGVAIALIVTAIMPSAGAATTPEVRLSLDFEGSARIVAVTVGAGDRVSKGQVLARVDGAESAAALAQAKGGLFTAVSALAKLTAAQTPEARAVDAVSVTQAKAAVTAASAAYADAVASARADDAGALTGVTSARAALAAMQVHVAAAVRSRQLAIEQATRAAVTAQASLVTDQQTVTDAKGKLAKDSAAVTSHGCTTASTDADCAVLAAAVDKDEQALAVASTAVAGSTAQVTQTSDALATVRQNDVSEAADDAQSLQQAQATLDSAVVARTKQTVQSRTALDQARATVLGARVSQEATVADNAAKHSAPTERELADARADAAPGSSGAAGMQRVRAPHRTERDGRDLSHLRHDAAVRAACRH